MVMDKPKEEKWQDEKALEAVRTLLAYMGEDPNREGLQDTPKRMLKAWTDYWGKGYNELVKDVMKTFKDGATDYDEMVLVKDIPIYSHCEHHVAPIIGKAHIAYIPAGRIIGLSKIARVADIFARRLQVQERLTTDIADALNTHLQPKGVAVVIEAEHLCMSSRGVQKQGSTTVTSKLMGCFADEHETRHEFMSLIRS
jgi:GTP cyclohydrolase I